MSQNNRNFLKTTISAVASSGLGALTISSAVSGNRTFVAGDDGKTFDGIRIEETGVGAEIRDGCVYTHSGTSLSRGTLVDSTTGSAIAFSAAAVVSQVLSAETATRIDAVLQTAVPGGRLTLESGVPVSTSDQTAKTTIYYTPFVHNGINLWDGAKWVPTPFTEKSLALGTLTSGRPYDVFGYLSGGQLVLEALAWTSDTARATAVTLQDGRYCKSGDKTRLLLGTFYTTSATTTEDSLANRYLWNAYNRAVRRVYVANSTSHTYTTASWREWNNGSGVSKLNFVSGLAIDALSLSMVGNIQISGATGTIGYLNIGYDSTTGSGNLVANLEGYGSSSSLSLSGSATVAGPLGRHYATCVQFGVANNTYAAYSLQGNIPC